MTDTGIHVAERSDRLSAGSLKLLVYGFELILLAVFCVLWASHRTKESTSTGEHQNRYGLEISTVLILMLLLSPMSSKPHFCILLVPAFFLARIAVKRQDVFLWILLLTVALIQLLTSNDVAGTHLAQAALWYGSVTSTALMLLFGCVYSLTRMKYTTH